MIQGYHVYVVNFMEHDMMEVRLITRQFANGIGQSLPAPIPVSRIQVWQYQNLAATGGQPVLGTSAFPWGINNGNAKCIRATMKQNRFQQKDCLVSMYILRCMLRFGTSPKNFIIGETRLVISGQSVDGLEKFDTGSENIIGNLVVTAGTVGVKASVSKKSSEGPSMIRP